MDPGKMKKKGLFVCMIAGEEIERERERDRASEVDIKRERIKCSSVTVGFSKATHQDKTLLVVA